MKCTQCGKEFDGKFCPECGAPAPGSPPAPEQAAMGKNKKKKKKPMGCLIVVLVVILLMAIAGGNGSEQDTPASPAASSEPSASPTPAPTPEPVASESAPTVEPTPDASAAPDPAASSEASELLSFDLVLSVLDLSAQNTYGDTYTLEGDEDGVTLSIWTDGLALGAAFAAQGNEEMLANWKELRDSMIQLCTSVQESIAEMGYSDTPVMVNVLNDQDKSKTLLSILNGVVIYDCATE